MVAECLGCVPLRTGTLMILWLHLIISLTGAVVLSIMKAMIRELPEEKVVLGLVWALLAGICSVWGLGGIVHNDEPSTLKPFIYLCVFETAIFAFEIFCNAVDSFLESGIRKSEPEIEVVMVFMVVFIQFCALLLSWHFLRIVIHYYKQRKAEALIKYQNRNSAVVQFQDEIL